MKEVAMKLHVIKYLGSGSRKCKSPVAGIVANEVLEVSRGLTGREVIPGF